mmetsp:Transcript_35632/g.71937  ORF Transcript_35632/g.71937 Transcript_35632/m.71937 type:complete len:136 (-) Transcript_35632:138-545(-)|eukprot:CAMPEP_0113820520 /NCGR_PEP_ID=MMETSP0328-20130328/1282_1 /TAXON_ID=39455 /ORGANISM="Alexandrium minutum" /LENGTH=135 /DNA_ID=CAMNT_0000788457 /DNA_START=98 /DNA_END=505 /DNA_ORIENTATION=+ /assembly_acc=CAM_ASM_000350
MSLGRRAQVVRVVLAFCSMLEADGEWAFTEHCLGSSGLCAQSRGLTHLRLSELCDVANGDIRSGTCAARGYSCNVVLHEAAKDAPVLAQKSIDFFGRAVFFGLDFYQEPSAADGRCSDERLSVVDFVPSYMLASG